MERALLTKLILDGIDPSGLLLNFDYLCVFKESTTSLYLNYEDHDVHVSIDKAAEKLKSLGFKFDSGTFDKTVAGMNNLTFVVYKIGKGKNLTKHEMHYLYSVPSSSLVV